ncbi:uncharacterized protein LOC122387373 [Amphibalanus amphitrite]|uniref:uncharacterized protein LOC122387373 n=1 Tax=Amphibalanus amphitrite TaxID=1232801 RepID=UPI001C909C5D|nr:uncharacterized protein LOC122387373 [Amphibalanus amphitrite]
MLWTSPLTVGLALVALVWTLPEAAGRPYRVKRVSDQRLAELETLLVLAKINREMQMNMPLGYGTADPFKLGRRKRTAPSGWEASGEGSRLALTPGDLRSQLGLRPAPAIDDDQISFSDRISSMMV